MRYPMVKVYCKPITDSVEDFVKSFPINRNATDQRSLIIESHRPEMRIGAFEVQLCIKVHGELKIELLHSKLATRVWPQVGAILNKIGIRRCTYTESVANYIPHTNINVKVYTITTEGGNKPLKGTFSSISS